MPISEVSHNRPEIVFGARVVGEDAVSGIVHVIRDEPELDKFREGEILVATQIPANWSHLFSLAKAIITETDDLPAHVSDAASALVLPVITGVQGVTSDLRSADIVMMHIDGAVQRLQERREPDSQMRVSVPAAVYARQFAGRVVGSENTGAGASVVTLKIAQRNEPDPQLDDDAPRKHAK